MSIYVGNLPYSVSQDDVEEIFKEYGTVKQVHLPKDRETDRPRGFGFVEMEREDDEQKAIDALDGAEWMGRELKVNKAKPKTEGNRSGRRDSGNGSFRGGRTADRY